LISAGVAMRRYRCRQHFSRAGATIQRQNARMISASTVTIISRRTAFASMGALQHLRREI
jgi:hypothetical protein